MRLKNKVAIITGAGSGIGRGIALAFIKEGAKVAVADWSEEGGNETLKLITEQDGEAIFVKTDVSKSADVTQLTKACIDKFGQVDILVNNAGILVTGNLHEMAEEDWDKVISINLKSVFLNSKAVLPGMLSRGKGKIISVASIAGMVGFAQSGAYCASKGGIIALTRDMALEYASKRINVNCICPGVINTAMTKDMLADSAERQFLEKATPYPRLGEPEDIAATAVYLASDESDFVNGTTIVVDGGWIAQ